MGSSRRRNSTPRARKARSAKPSSKPRHKPRLWLDGSPATQAEIGTELRIVAKQLKRVESYVTVARMALDGQNAEQDNEVATLLQRDVGDLLFKQIRSLENTAARCDGGPRSDRDDDDEFEGDAGGDV